MIYCFSSPTANINGAGRSVHILHAHCSFLCSLLRWYLTVKHEFSEQHMRIVNYQRSLISPISVYGWNYKLFLVSSGSYWSRSAWCEEICFNLCILGVFNWEIWNANSNGSGLTALCHLIQTFADRSSLTFSERIKWHHLKHLIISLQFI